MKLNSPAAERNRDAIADVLERWLPATGLVLEVASGTGEHVVHFARRQPALTWQPSDPAAEARASIAEWSVGSDVLAPLPLDAASPNWPIDEAAAIICINMVHISRWAATLGLFAGAARLLPTGAPLILYGPFRRDGVPTAPTNEVFDVSLKSRDPAWGLRSVEAVAGVSPAFALESLEEMPANNLMLLFRRAA